MKRKFRLTSSTDFQRVRRFGKSYAHPLIVLIAQPGEAGGLHIGVAAGRTVGKAVQRNRAKRRLRAALQPYLEKIQPGWELVLIARQPLAGATFQQTQAVLRSLLQRAHLLIEAHDD